MENNKIYKEIPNHSMYHACSDGNVYRKSDNTPMKGTLNHGSRSVELRTDSGVSKTYHLGKLMAESFGIVYPYTGTAWIRYKDNDSLNTAPDNLYWEGNYTGLVEEPERSLFKPHPKYDNVLSSEDGRICDTRWQLYKLHIRNSAVCILVYPAEETPQQKGAKKYNTLKAAQVIASTWLEYPQGTKEWPIACKDSNMFNLAASNLIIVASLVSPDELHLFRPVPTYPDTSVSACGRVINHKNMLEYTTDCKNTNAYNTVHIKRPDGKTGKVTVHRLVAMVWLDRPDNYLELEVNHINGIKHDNRVENLEWVTSSGNKQHSVRTDLANSNMPCILIQDSQTTRFKSISDVARHLKTDAVKIKTLIKHSPNLELIVYKDKDKSVTALNGQIIVPSTLPFKLFNQAIIAHNIITKETSVYDNASKAGKLLNLDGDTLGHRATVEYKWPLMNYLFRWADSENPAPFREFTEDELKVFNGKSVRLPTRAIYPNGVIELFTGTKEMSTKFGLDKMQFRYYISSRKPYNGIFFEYLK